MERDQLRSVQDPLKERYREAPDAALVSFRAVGTLGEGITCSVATGRAIAEAGLHPATGGDGSLLCSGDMLGEVRVEGDLDFRGTLAVTKDDPVGFRAIRVTFDINADATSDELYTLIRLTERYCVVLQSLAKSPELSVSRSA